MACAGSLTVGVAENDPTTGRGDRTMACGGPRMAPSMKALGDARMTCADGALPLPRMRDTDASRLRATKSLARPASELGGRTDTGLAKADLNRDGMSLPRRLAGTQASGDRHVELRAARAGLVGAALCRRCTPAIRVVRCRRPAGIVEEEEGTIEGICECGRQAAHSAEVGCCVFGFTPDSPFAQDDLRHYMGHDCLRSALCAATARRIASGACAFFGF